MPPLEDTEGGRSEVGFFQLKTWSPISNQTSVLGTTINRLSDLNLLPEEMTIPLSSLPLPLGYHLPEKRMLLGDFLGVFFG